MEGKLHCLGSLLMLKFSWCRDKSIFSCDAFLALVLPTGTRRKAEGRTVQSDNDADDPDSEVKDDADR